MTTKIAPSDKDIAAAKSEAAERFGSAAVELIELDEPVNTALLMAPFDRPGWAKYVDALHRDAVTAHGQAFAERVLFPALPQAMALRAEWPLLPSMVVKQMAASAGDVADIATVRRLDARALPVGLDPKEAEALVAAASGAALWSVELPAVELSCVMRAPTADVYLAAMTADREARAKGAQVINSMAPYILESVVWSATAIELALDRRPAVIGDLRRAYLRMGGEGAAVRSKRL